MAEPIASDAPARHSHSVRLPVLPVPRPLHTDPSRPPDLARVRQEGHHGGTARRTPAAVGWRPALGKDSAGAPVAFKTSPSAGARQPIVAYVAVRRVQGLRAGLYRYSASGHSLERIATGLTSRRLEAVRRPAVVVWQRQHNRLSRWQGRPSDGSLRSSPRLSLPAARSRARVSDVLPDRNMDGSGTLLYGRPCGLAHRTRLRHQRHRRDSCSTRPASAVGPRADTVSGRTMSQAARTSGLDARLNLVRGRNDDRDDGGMNRAARGSRRLALGL